MMHHILDLLLLLLLLVMRLCLCLGLRLDLCLLLHLDVEHLHIQCGLAVKRWVVTVHSARRVAWWLRRDDGCVGA